VGRPGREAVLAHLPGLRQEHRPRFVIVNGENSAAGVGITPEIAEQLLGAGVDAITLGNHAFHKREITPYLDSGAKIVRPANMPSGVPGNGWVVVEREGTRLGVANLCGRTFLDGYNDPFAEIDRILPELSGCHVLVDFHAEATSEKQAFGFHLDGRATAVLGTHTHVPTADERVLEGGTAYITDVGMCGPWPSVLGMDREIILRRFRTSLPTRFEVADEPGVICGAVVRVQSDTGRAVGIRRVGGLALEHN
jgi:hypothetical protein